MSTILNPINKQEWLKLRLEDITSTEVSSLFGCNPYLSHFELWNIKKLKQIPEFLETERIMWGSKLEAVIAEGIASKNNWTIKKVNEYYRNKENRIGSSFDFFIVEKDKEFVFEIKNVDSLVFKNNWVVDTNVIEPPAHIELQVQHQMFLSGTEKAYLGVLVGGNRSYQLCINRNEKIISSILKKVSEFWESIERNQPPEIDFEKDSSYIISMYNYSEPGKVLDLSDQTNEQLSELCDQYLHIGRQERELKNKKDEIKAKILCDIMDYEKVFTKDGYTITANTVGPATIEYERKPYRQFRINKKKNQEKKNGR